MNLNLKSSPLHYLPVALLVTIIAGCTEELPASFTGPKREVAIKTGMSITAIAESLRSKEIINSVLAFRLFSWLYNCEGRIQPGRYRLPIHTHPKLVLKIITREIPAQLMITIPEGYTVKQIARLFEENGICPQESLLSACTDTLLLRSLEIPFSSAEGYLFPETYEFQTNSDARAVVRRLVHQFRVVFNRLKEKGGTNLREPEAVILASIVEKEARIPDEFPVIAGVFLNRLKRHLPLQSCATVEFILPVSRPRLTLEDLKTPSPYNTYLHPGLPPGPICNPGARALEAVLYPAQHQYLFFVSKGDGSHIFSRTAAEHEAAVRRVKQLRQANGQ